MNASAARLKRERHTIQAMIQLYCRDHHASRGSLCSECQSLADYANERLEHCPYAIDKPTCVKCPIHCYRLEQREKVRQVMRYAGPRMIWRHPILAIFHILDGRQPAPANKKS